MINQHRDADDLLNRMNDGKIAKALNHLEQLAVDLLPIEMETVTKLEVDYARVELSDLIQANLTVPLATEEELTKIEPFYGILTIANAQLITDLLNGVLRFPCTVVTIIRDTEWVEVRTSVVHDKNADGSVAKLTPRENDQVGIGWTGGGWNNWIQTSKYDDPTRIEWRQRSCWSVVIRQAAPAGHPVVWVISPNMRRVVE